MFKFRYIVTFAGILLAGTAAYFSVIGLSQLFAGAGIAIVVMASSLEFTKLVAASLLERYWSVIGIGLKIFFSLAVVLLICITSAGIYGLLSSGYEKTSSQLGIHNTEVKLIEAKISNYQTTINSNTSIIDNKTKRATSLTELRNRQESRLDSLDIKNDWGSRSTANKIRKDIKNANGEIGKLTNEIDSLVVFNTAIMDSIGAKNISILEKEANNEAGAELGPLKYLAELTSTDMDTVISYFILAIIIVFDPLAIALIIMANKLAVGNKKNVVTIEDNVVTDETVKSLSSKPIKVTNPIKFNPDEWVIKDFIGEYKLKGQAKAIAEQRKLNDEVMLGVIREEAKVVEDTKTTVTSDTIQKVLDKYAGTPVDAPESIKEVIESINVEPVKEEPVKEEAGIVEAAKVEPTKVESVKVEPAKAENTFRNFTVNIPKNNK